MKERYERRKIMEKKKITIGYLMSEDFEPTPFKEMADADKLAIWKHRMAIMQENGKNVKSKGVMQHLARRIRNLEDKMATA